MKVVICVVCLLVTEIFAACETGNDCIPITQCPWISNIFERKLFVEEMNDILFSQFCGYYQSKPKLCCDKELGPCVTPQNTAGYCAPLSKCRTFIDMLEEKPLFNENAVNFIRESECQYGKDNLAKVCCPLLKPKFPPTPDTNNNFVSQPDLPLPGKCGIQAGENKVFGGNATDLAEFPWMALLEYGEDPFITLRCGGSLISSKFVLTAAHCVHFTQIRRYGRIRRVRLGEYDTTSKIDCIEESDSGYYNKECAPEVIRPEVEAVIPHEQFSHKDINGFNDIALIKLKKTVAFTEYVKPICLPLQQTKIPNSFHVSGWGKTETDRESTVKLKVQVPIFDKDTCAEFYKNKRWPRVINENQLCAAGEIGKDSCSGDSGGPLMAKVIQKTSIIWFQFGVVSYGPTACGNGEPSVYTSVISYIPWIIDHLRM